MKKNSIILVVLMVSLVILGACSNHNSASDPTVTLSKESKKAEKELMKEVTKIIEEVERTQDFSAAYESIDAYQMSMTNTNIGPYWNEVRAYKNQLADLIRAQQNLVFSKEPNTIVSSYRDRVIPFLDTAIAEENGSEKIANIARKNKKIAEKYFDENDKIESYQ